MALENIIHNDIPRSIPPATMTKKVRIHFPIVALVNTHDCNISSTIKNTATAVPSLKRLSHSKISVNLLDIHRSLKIERTATGSVDAITIPNRNNTDNGIANPIHQRISPDR